MLFTNKNWQTWLTRNVNDMQSPARVSTLTWIAYGLICLFSLTAFFFGRLALGGT